MGGVWGRHCSCSARSEAWHAFLLLDTYVDNVHVWSYHLISQAGWNTCNPLYSILLGRKAEASQPLAAPNDFEGSLIVIMQGNTYWQHHH